MPSLSPRAFLDRRSQADADIFHRVVVVHMGITLGGNLKVESAVFAEGFQHMGKERNGGFDLVGAGPVQVQGQFDVGFFGLSLEDRDALGHRISKISFKSLSFCSGVPTEIRRESLSLGWEKYLTKTRFFLRFL